MLFIIPRFVVFLLRAATLLLTAEADWQLVIAALVVVVIFYHSPFFSLSLSLSLLLHTPRAHKRFENRTDTHTRTLYEFTHFSHSPRF